MHLRFLNACLIILAIIAASSCAVAQTCTGSLGAPVLNETFGAGTTEGNGPELPVGSTQLYYSNLKCGGPDIDYPQGTYTLENALPTTCKGATWHNLPYDHTGNKFGYFMVINAADQPSLFYTKIVPGSSLCPNTSYFFGVYILNLLRPLARTQGFVKPNIRYVVETTTGTILAQGETGNIAETDLPQWKQYGAMFTSPADGTNVVIRMYNKAPGGNGNDIAMDDITFSPCGPLIRAGFNTIENNGEKPGCAGGNFSYTLVSDQTGYTNPDYQWQLNKNDGAGWKNIDGEKYATYKIVLGNAAAGRYQYRVGLLNKTSIAAEQCRIYAEPLTLMIYAKPDIQLATTTNVCAGQTLRLSAAGGHNAIYEWRNQQGVVFSTEDSPAVSYSASYTDQGDYTLKVTENGCPGFYTTRVTVFAAVTAQPMANASTCEGVPVQLQVVSNNGTHFKWSPAAGLNHDDIPDPVATPSATTQYSVEVSNDACPDNVISRSMTLTVSQKPVANAGQTIRIFEGQSTVLQGSATGAGINIYWSPATYLSDATALKPVATPTSDITYTLHAISDNNCGENSSSVFVRVYKKISLSNTFTPNGDGYNDVWTIQNINFYPQADINIYNRLGQQVYHSISYPKPWNGTYNNNPLPAGTYYYIIDLKEDGLPKISGWLMITR
ncbi:T9SS type B sorting domain-containing protein [Mucilaginibacter sp.]